MMHLIWTILIGFLAGLVARAVTPGSGPTGFFLTAGLGIGGSVIATFLGEKLGLYHAGDIAGFIASVIGAVVLLVIYNVVSRKSN
jgi:uncharacterized membrane protein YeaQ/YmgE (transglycosylase-associated protein family)